MMLRKRVSVSAREGLKEYWKIRMEDTLNRYGGDQASLLPCLEIIQETVGYVAPEAISYLSQTLNLPAARVYGIASFYGLLTTRKKGKYVVRLCSSLGCQLSVDRHILRCLERELDIHEKETTRDGQFSLEVVPCLGLCDRSPAMMINEKVYGSLTEISVREILADYKAKV